MTNFPILGKPLSKALAGIGVALVPESVRRLHRDDVEYRSLAEAGVVSPVIMNFRAGDRSALLARFRELVSPVSARPPASAA
jgi:DNA-binding transcriptional LysR family regulator